MVHDLIDIQLSSPRRENTYTWPSQLQSQIHAQRMPRRNNIIRQRHNLLQPVLPAWRYLCEQVLGRADVFLMRFFALAAPCEAEDEITALKLIGGGPDSCDGALDVDVRISGLYLYRESRKGEQSS